MNFDEGSWNFNGNGHFKDVLGILLVRGSKAFNRFVVKSFSAKMFTFSKAREPDKHS